MYENLKAEIVRAGMVAIQSELEERNGAAYSLDYLFGDGDENGEGQSDQGAHASSVRPD